MSRSGTSVKRLNSCRDDDSIWLRRMIEVEREDARSSRDAVVEGELGRSRSCLDIEFSVNGVEVVSDCAVTDAQSLPDLGVGEAVGNEPKHIDLAGRELAGARWRYPRSRGLDAQAIKPIEHRLCMERFTNRSGHMCELDSLLVAGDLMQRRQRDQRLRPLPGNRTVVAQVECPAQLDLGRRVLPAIESDFPRHAMASDQDERLWWRGRPTQGLLDIRPCTLVVGAALGVADNYL